jgi:hypothetical protein
LRRWVRGGAALLAFVVVTSISEPSMARRFLSREDALARKRVSVVRGDRSRPWRTCALDDQTFDIRMLSSTGNFGDLSNLSVGNDCGAARTVVVGGRAKGRLRHSRTWAWVKEHDNSSGLRIEGKVWMASYDLRVADIEDGFRPRVRDGTERRTKVRFLLSGAYMDWIRDDAIEDDDLMSGVVEDMLIDGTDRFLSARPVEGSHFANHRMVVRVRDVLVHMKAMRNGRARDGRGFGAIFKWSDQAGSVDMADSIFLLDERPIEDEPFPRGTYSNVRLVLGPHFRGGYPTPLPAGVRTTRDLSVWRKARRAWLNGH